jgi:type IV secretory pathway protease TraF
VAQLSTLGIIDVCDMRPVKKIAIRVFLGLVIVYLVLLLLAHSVFMVKRMKTGSMQPLISTNDLVVATRWFRVASLHSGDLVVADIPITDGSHILTVRKIEQKTNTPAGQFYLQAASTNGLDSHFFGGLPASAIRGRVIWIFR